MDYKKDTWYTTDERGWSLGSLIKNPQIYNKDNKKDSSLLTGTDLYICRIRRKGPWGIKKLREATQEELTLYLPQYHPDWVPPKDIKEIISEFLC